MADPTLLALSGYWRANYTGLPWAAVATAGISSTTNSLVTNVNDPTTSAAQNGYTGADYNGTSQHTIGTATVSDAATIYAASAKTILCLFKARTAAAPRTNLWEDPGLIIDANADTGLNFTTSGVTAFAYDGAYRTAIVSCATGAYHLAMMRHDGTNIGVTLDSGAEVTSACAASTVFTGDIQNGQGYTGLSYFDGIILELATAKYSFSNTDYANFKSYANLRYALAL